MGFKSFLTAIMCLVLLGCASSSVPGPSEPGFSSQQSSFHDWGDIDIMGGSVSHDFILQNTTQKPLLLRGAVTSCMCTTAQVTLQDGTLSPVFGMHENEEWSYEVQPDESFQVKVVFDPLAHGPTAVGPVRRTVNIISDADPENRGITYTRLDVQGNVVSEANYQQSYDE
ncbi:MAG: DUF1573 domain-containing protein [Candidatus Altimarinota bacterium]